MRRLVAGVLLLFAGHGLAACANVATNTGVYYNEGLAESFNSIMLKNIIRAAKNYPLYYSALGDFSQNDQSQLQLSPSVSIPLNLGSGPTLSNIDITAAGSPSMIRSRNANAASLETEQFIQAMHTPISNKTLVFIYEGHERIHFNLILMLLTDRVTIGGPLDQIVGLAYSKCLETGGGATAFQLGICRNLADPAKAGGVCAAQLNQAGATLQNEPTNPCGFALFELFVDAFVALEPKVTIQPDGSAEFFYGAKGATSGANLLPKITLHLRSPHQVIHYLGRVVKQTFLGADKGMLTLTSVGGKEIPLFIVKEGKKGKGAAVSTTVDDETYWLPKQSLRTADRSYTFAALGIVKAIISLNTSPSQLPSVPTTVLVR